MDEGLFPSTQHWNGLLDGWKLNEWKFLHDKIARCLNNTDGRFATH
jgi:hypothetical protein